ncbi:MAG: hypothetical protein V1775_06100 [Bacteroidota bacterium]
MKTANRTLTGFFFLISSILLLSGCKDNSYEEITYKANVPVYMGLEEFRGAVKRTSPQPLENPGKIYFKDNYLFVNEYHKGVHVINNSNPSAPNPVAFIEIPGNVDIAIRNNILFADSFIDLVAVDITDPSNPVEVDRVEDAFPNVLPPLDYTFPVYGLDFTKGVVIGWETKDVTEVVERGSDFNKEVLVFDGLGVAAIGGNEVSIGPSASGISGSMARFTINTDFMYAVHNNNLKVFNIAVTPGITTGNVVALDRQVETIFPYNNKLFLGTTTGMMVYDLSSPANPTFLSEFTHINSCDPVVVEGNLAYVTLRSGTQCNGFTNQLDVVDISSLTNPFLVKSYPMYNPHGLGIDNHTLFICDGDAGLKVYDATDPMEIHMHQLAHYADIKTYDVIPYNGLLMMIGADGLYQYDYSDLDSLKLLSHIPVVIP